MNDQSDRKPKEPLQTSALIFRLLRQKPHTADELVNATGKSLSSVQDGLKNLRVEARKRSRAKGGKGGTPPKEWALMTGPKLLDLFYRSDNEGC